MILVDQREIDLILNARMRKRTFTIPYRYGEFGELKRAPRIGSVHTLRAPSQYETWKREASEQPTRARAVLWLIDQAQPKRTTVVTVLDVSHAEDGWQLTFAKGDQTSRLDRPRLLKARVSSTHYDDEHGYTYQPALALQSEPEAISAQLLNRYALEANARDLERRPPRTERDRQREKRRRRRAAESVRCTTTIMDEPTAVPLPVPLGCNLTAP